MGSRFLTIPTGSNLPKIRQAREPEPSIINEMLIPLDVAHRSGMISPTVPI